METTPSPSYSEATQAEHAAAAAADAAGLALNARLWVRAIEPVLQLRSSEPDPSPRVQHALDRVLIAAAERAIRILGADQSNTA